jgi:hypothetical protein
VGHSSDRTGDVVLAPGARRLGNHAAVVTVALAIAIPLVLGRGGTLAAVAFGIAGFQAAYDLVGLLSLAQWGDGGRSAL